MGERLSEQEKVFLDVLTSTECMSLYEAHLILYRYMNSSEGKRIAMFNHLKRGFYLDITSDGKYMVAGSRQKGTGEGKLKKGTIAALYVALEILNKDNETEIDALQCIYKPSGLGTLTFISNNQIYTIYALAHKDIYKIKLIADQYRQKEHRLNTDIYVPNSNFKEYSIFLFLEPEKTEDILQNITEMELDIPHKIAITRSQDVSEKVLFDIYEAEQE